MKNKEGLVSIIITSYNYGKFIGKTIESIIFQTYPNWELIIADDASTDNSIEVIKQYKDPRIRLITSNKNQGAFINFQRAFQLCQGEYLASIDSDDYISPQNFEKQITTIKEKNIDICGTFISQINNENNIIKNSEYEKWFNQNLNLNQPDNWIWSNRLCHSSVLMKKAIYEKECFFDKDLIFAPDYDLWIKCLAGNFKFYVIPEKLTFYRVHTENITKKDPLKYFWEYLYISLKTFHPYLFKINRHDLISKNIESFLNPKNYFNVSKTDQAKLLELLFSKQIPSSFKEILNKLKNPPSTINYIFVANYIDYKNEETSQIQKKINKLRKKLNISINKKYPSQFQTIEDCINFRNNEIKNIEQENIKLKEKIKIILESLKKENNNLFFLLNGIKSEIALLEDAIYKIESSLFFKIWQKVKKII